jgi:hypothetical protein
MRTWFRCHFCHEIVSHVDPHYGEGIGHEACELKAAHEARKDYLAGQKDIIERLDAS